MFAFLSGIENEPIPDPFPLEGMIGQKRNDKPKNEALGSEPINRLLEVFPNPNQGSFRVRGWMEGKTGRLEVQNGVFGNKVASYPINESGNFEIELNLSNLTAGLYILSLLEGEAVKQAEKIIIQK